MGPPISKDLWLAAAITSTTLPTALAQPAPPAAAPASLSALWRPSPLVPRSRATTRFFM